MSPFQVAVEIFAGLSCLAILAYAASTINALRQSRKKPVHVDAVPLGFHKKISQVVEENEELGKARSDKETKGNG